MICLDTHVLEPCGGPEVIVRIKHVVRSDTDDVQSVPDYLPRAILSQSAEHMLHSMLEADDFLLHGRDRVCMGRVVVETGARKAVTEASPHVHLGPARIKVSCQGVLDPQRRDDVVDDEPPVGEPPRRGMVGEVGAVGQMVASVFCIVVDVVAPRVDTGVAERIDGRDAPSPLLLCVAMAMVVVAMVVFVVVVVVAMVVVVSVVVVSMMVVVSGGREREEEKEMGEED